MSSSIMSPYFALPDEAMTLIVTARCEYTTLSLVTIDEWLTDLFVTYRIDPAYLFLSSQAARDLRALVREQYRDTSFTRIDLLARELFYVNPVTGTQLDVVVLPHLSADILLVGDLGTWSRTHHLRPFPF